MIMIVPDREEDVVIPISKEKTYALGTLHEKDFKTWTRKTSSTEKIR